MSAEDTEHKRNTHDDEYALEYVAKRNLKFRQFSDVVVACKVQVHFTPECKVERGGEDADSRVECGK